MHSKKIYQSMNTEFILDGITDDWSRHIAPYKEYLTQSYKDTFMGLMFDFTDNINYVFTAVFLSDEVVEYASLMDNAIILVHHPLNWDLQKYAPEAFGCISSKSIEKLKEKNISVLNMHTPLDNYSPYGTSSTLAEALNLKISKPFCPYFGTLAGVICDSTCTTINELSDIFSKAIGHTTKVFNYGNSDIANQDIAVVAGGGCDMDVITEVKELGIHTLVTGVTRISEYSVDAHNFAKENDINIIGGTHYSTEQFAMKEMLKYFRDKFDLDGQFIPQCPSIFDL